MKKLGKRLGIVLIILAVLYGAWMLFVNPSGYTDKVELATDYFNNLDSANSCEEYFNPETSEYCDSFSALFDGEDVTVKKAVARSSIVVVTIEMNGNEQDFEVSFIAEPVTGIKRFFNNQYYLIDDIQ